MIPNSLQVLIQAKDDASKVLNRITRNIKSAGASAEALGRKMRLVSAGAGLALVGATKAAGDFQAKMSNVATLISGDSAPAISELSNLIRKTAKETGVLHNELATSAYSIYSAGITEAKQAQNALLGSVRLSIAGLGSASESTDILTSSINAFASQNVSGEKAAELMFNAVKNGKTTVSELAQGFGQVAPRIAQAGITMESFTAATSAVTTVGTSASEVYTGFRTAIGALQRPTERTAKLFRAVSKTTGQSITDFEDLVKYAKGDLGKVFQTITKAVEENDIKLQGLIRSTEAVGIINTLATTVQDSYTTALRTANDESARALQLQEAYVKQQSTFNTSWNRLKASLYDLGIAFGNILLPHIQTAIDFVSNLVQRFSGLDAAVQTAILVVAGLVAGMSPFLIVIGKMAAGIDVVIGALKKLKISFKSLALTTLIGALLLLALLLINHWDKVKKFFSNIWEEIKPFWNDFVGYLSDFWKNLKDTWKDFDKTFQELLDTIGVEGSTAAFLLKGALGILGGGFLIVTGFAVGLLRILQAIVYVIERVITGIKHLVNAVKSIPAGLFNTFSKGFGDFSADFGKYKPLTRFASGGISQGGLSLVGERGPELVNLPRGSRVYSNEESMKMSSPTYNFNGDFIINEQSTGEKVVQMLQNQLELSQSGVPSDA